MYPFFYTVNFHTFYLLLHFFNAFLSIVAEMS